MCLPTGHRVGTMAAWVFTAEQENCGPANWGRETTTADHGLSGGETTGRSVPHA